MGSNTAAQREGANAGVLDPSNSNSEEHERSTTSPKGLFREAGDSPREQAGRADNARLVAELRGASTCLRFEIGFGSLH